MINVLIADDNLEFSIKIINEISKNMDIRICKVCTNGNEVLKTLNDCQVDIVILDMIMPICDGWEVIKQLSDSQKEKYENSIIAISGNSWYLSKTINNPLVYDFILKGTQLEEIINRIKKLVDVKNITYKRQEIMGELEKIGYDIGHKGTIYLIEAIFLIYSKGENIVDNLQKDIYPIIAKAYHKTINNIKCNINNATEAMYYKCDSTKLKEYFNFYDDTKPTTKTVIYTVLNNIIKGKDILII